MKIWGEIPKVTGVYDKQKKVDKANVSKDSKQVKDALSISDKGRDFQTILRALKDVPDIRSEKVQNLSERIQAGSYKQDERAISEKILKSIFDKKV